MDKLVEVRLLKHPDTNKLQLKQPQTAEPNVGLEQGFAVTVSKINNITEIINRSYMFRTL